MRALLLLLALVGALLRPVAAQPGDETVVVGHPGVGRVDAALLQRLYTGRAVEVAGTPVQVVGLAPGDPARARFLARIVGLDDERYVAYWTVRRHVGKGAPPREFRTPRELAAHVQSTPGASLVNWATDLAL